MGINADSQLTFREAVSLYLDYLIGVRRASPHTVKAYKTDLLQFAAWAGRKDSPDGAFVMTTTVVSSYVLQLKQQGYSSATQARKIASIKALFKFCRSMEYAPFDFSDHLARPRVTSTLPKAVSVQLVQRIIEATAETREPYGSRDRAMLETLYATGLRVSELLGINIRDIDFEDRILRCYGKGNRERIVPIHDEAIFHLREYLTSTRTRLQKSNSSDAVFLNRFGKRLSRQGFWLTIKRYSSAIGTTKTITPHTFRHSFATHMIEGGAPISYVQAMLGHRSVSTTEVYNHVANQYIREEFEAAQPRMAGRA
jgi:integrase/recombinase XerD